MSYIFYNCYNLNHVKIDFEIFYILDGKEMFYNCYSLKSIKLDSLKTKKDSNDFIDISNMFYNCSNIESITFNSSNPDFGVKDMQNMFYNCLSLKYVDLSSLNSSYDYNINMSRLFYNFTFLEKVDGFINDFYIIDTTEMFYNCTSLKSIDLVRFQTNEDIFINSSYMFYNCPQLEYVCFSSLIEKYGIQKIKDIFYNCISLKQVDIRGLKSSNEHYVNMSKLFYDLTNLTTILGDFNPLYLSDTRKNTVVFGKQI
jgi:surface protein